MKRAALALALVALALVAVLWVAGRGTFGTPVEAGEPKGGALPGAVLAAREARLEAATARLDVSNAKQILFGDLHVHSSFSLDAYQLALPLGGGDGVHPVADACDFARYCADLDFWSINDHAASLTPRKWRETIDSLRQCNEVAGSSERPDLVSFLGWEWTQIGSTPENHYGHKNVILRDLEDERIPTRPIVASPPPGVPSAFDAGRGGTFALGLAAFAIENGHDIAGFLNEIGAVPACETGVPVRELPPGCRESAGTPEALFAKLRDWGLASMVIPHGTTWGMYTPPGSSWAKQLDPGQHDPLQQPLLEVYSGHGNSEEFRSWQEVRIGADGSRACPESTGDYLPACRRAGEIIRERCAADGVSAQECEDRAAQTRQYFVDADRNGGAYAVPGATVADWLEAGQCTDCFQPAFNYRPKSSAQYMLALSRESGDDDPLRFRFGFIASSDNHTARAGTGYKEVARREMADARMGEIGTSTITQPFRRAPSAVPTPLDPAAGVPTVALLEAERGSSFLLTGGLAAVHSQGRDREAIWDALARKETYGTSGPRILLWFDHVDDAGTRHPMGSEIATSSVPTFAVRAAGSFEQQPGCPDYASAALSPEHLARLCQGECYYPSDRRRVITRIEVVRIRPQQTPDEGVAALIEDPWRRFDCPLDRAGCEVVFRDPEYASAGQDTTYYVRAIEEPSDVVSADPLRCERDAEGRCVSVDPCFSQPDDDDCLAPSEQRAWSSPIYLEFDGNPTSASTDGVSDSTM